MANIDNLNKVIDFLKHEKDNEEKKNYFHFDMSIYLDTKYQDVCGTAGCIAGACIVTNRGLEYYQKMPYRDVPTEAADWLELTDEEVWALFCGDVETGILRKITKEHAIKVLEHFRDTGEIDWQKDAPEGSERWDLPYLAASEQ